jgi:hypothetical protein
MTETTKTTPPDAPAPAEKPVLKAGDVVRLRAVHGYIQDPFTLDSFDTDSEKKVVANGWTLVQLAAEKLAIVE